jgi:AAA family ATP:ADP antiporter
MSSSAGSTGEPTSHNALERLLRLMTRVRPGEGRCVVLFFAISFLFLFAYYIIKALREGFILTEFGAEGRAYATGAMAVLLMFLVPLYSALRRRVDGVPLTQAVTGVFIITTLGFIALTLTDLKFGFVFFIWVGLYGIALVAHFWSFVADTLNLKSGQRLFPLIMVGGSLGALVGGQVAKRLIGQMTPAGLMMIAAGALLVTLFLAAPARQSVPAGSRSIPLAAHEQSVSRILGGFATVFSHRYLVLIALLVVVLNCVNSTGEFVLADVVTRHAAARVAADPTLDQGVLITRFYGEFLFTYTLLGLVTQAFVVAHVYRWVGVRGALIISPLVAALSYGLVVFVPVFGLIRAVKVLENALDYSLTNTTRQALFLPVNRAAKYDGKMTIDTFFQRFGDLLQAGLVFLGVHRWGFGTAEFALLNLGVSLVWLWLAWMIGREFQAHAQLNLTNVAPEARCAIPDYECLPGGSVVFVIAHDAFVDSDPGDVLHYRARCHDGSELPVWLRFDPHLRRFTGTPPATFTQLRLVVVASDMDGLEASSSFVLRRLTQGA